jgi:large subunit ribosomal protein L15
MQIHDLKPNNKFKKRKRVGRGGKRGTYSGKGMKGQRARSGTGGTGIAEKGRSSWVKRIPKLGGFNAVKLPNILVKSEKIEVLFAEGETINPETLKAKRLLGNLKKGRSGVIQRVKILYSGEVTKKLIFSDCIFSKKAKETIEKAGGVISN